MMVSGAEEKDVFDSGKAVTAVLLEPSWYCEGINQEITSELQGAG